MNTLSWIEGHKQLDEMSLKLIRSLDDVWNSDVFSVELNYDLMEAILKTRKVLEELSRVCKKAIRDGE